MTFYLRSDHGHLVVNDGVVDVLQSCYESPELRPIVRIDVDEWRAHYPGESLESSTQDILDFGYWYRDANGVEHYEPPCDDWRALLQR